jgi:hypothetical protein
MKNLTLLLLLLFEIQLFGQTYKEKVSFKSDLWSIDYAEEAVRTKGDTVNLIWVKKSISARKNVIYVDVSNKGTTIGIKYPKVLNLSSEGLENNGFIGEKWYGKYNMHIQTYAKDQYGNLWQVTVGNDQLSEDASSDPTGKGRIYITIQDTHGIQSGWYFSIKTFGNLKK